MRKKKLQTKKVLGLKPTKVHKHIRKPERNNIWKVVKYKEKKKVAKLYIPVEIFSIE